jgi:hypothetical protein
MPRNQPGPDEWREQTAADPPRALRVLLGSMLCPLLCACGGGGGSSGSSMPPPPPLPPASATLLYVTNESAGTIDGFTIDATTGVPTPISGSPMTDGPTPAALAIDPQKGYLYVASPSGEVRGYQLDSSTGALTAMGGSPFPTEAQSVAITVDPSGQFVLTANGTSNTVSAFQMGSTLPPTFFTPWTT